MRQDGTARPQRWTRPLAGLLLSAALMGCLWLGSATGGLASGPPQSAFGPEVTITLTPEQILAARAALRQRGQALADSDEGLVATPDLPDAHDAGAVARRPPAAATPPAPAADAALDAQAVDAALDALARTLAGWPTQASPAAEPRVAAPAPTAASRAAPEALAMTALRPAHRPLAPLSTRLSRWALVMPTRYGLPVVSLPTIEPPAETAVLTATTPSSSPASANPAPSSPAPSSPASAPVATASAAPVPAAVPATPGTPTAPAQVAAATGAEVPLRVDRLRTLAQELAALERDAVQWIGRPPAATAPVPALSGADVPLRSTSRKPMIAIVIDDLGLQPAATRRTIALKGPLTLAFLPYGSDLQGPVDSALARGHEVLLHMPMEPRRSRVSPGPNALLTSLTPEEQARRLEWALGRFRGFVGVNNHMGSAFTESAPGMRLVLEQLRARGLFFLDSRTTERSSARDLAGAIEIPYAERDVFLDNHQEGPYVALQLLEVEDKARRYGSAIAIGHPHASTIETLAAWLDTLDSKGFELVPVSRVIAKRGIPDWRLVMEQRRPAGVALASDRAGDRRTSDRAGATGPARPADLAQAPARPADARAGAGAASAEPAPARLVNAANR